MSKRKKALARGDLLKQAGRRKFLSRALIGGIGTSLYLGTESTIDATQAENLCAGKASVVEAIIFYKDSVIKIKSEAFRKLIGRIGAVAEECADQFVALCEKVKLLEIEIIKSSKRKQVQQMQALAEIGCDAAMQLRNSADLPRDTSQQLVASIVRIKKQIGSLAEDLLPDGETVLSPAATRILRDIVIAVHSSAAIDQKIKEAQAASRADVKLIDEKTGELQNKLSAAASEVLRKEKSSTAIEFVNDAIATLQALMDELIKRKLDSGISLANTLMGSLEGVVYWIEHPEAVEETSSRGPAIDTVTFSQAAFLYTSSSSSAAQSGVNGLLLNYYPPDGYIKASAIYTVVVGAQKTRMLARRAAAALGHGKAMTYDEIFAAVKNSVLDYGFSCVAEYRGHKCNLDAFVKGLTAIVIG